MPNPERQPLPPEAYARVFDMTPEGKAVLEELVRIFARPAKLTGGIDAILATYHNDGARRVVEFIASQINRANGVEEPNDD